MRIRKFNAKFEFHKLCLILIAMCIVSNNVFGSDEKLYVISKLVMLLFFCISILYIIKVKTISVNVYFFTGVCFFIIEFISCLWAVNKDVAFSQFITQTQLFVLFAISFLIFKNEITIKYIYLALYISGYCLLLFSLYKYGVNGYLNSFLSGVRLGGLIGNENGFGRVYTLAAITSFFCIVSFEKYKILNIVSTLIFLINILGSGSRGALVFFTIGIALILILKFGLKQVWKTILLGLIAITLLYFLLSLDSFSMINNRFDGLIGDNKEDSFLGRSLMISVGLELIEAKPFLGYGLNNFSVVSGFGTYSHNNFIEVGVSLGIFGLILLYIPFFVLIYKLFRRYRHYKNSNYLILLVICIVYCIYGIATVELYAKDFWIIYGCAFAALMERGTLSRNVGEK